MVKYHLLMDTVGSRIKELRRHLGAGGKLLSMDALGRLAGVTKQAVWQWENDVTQPERDALLALQANGRINPDWVMSGKGSWLLPESTTGQPAQEGSGSYDTLSDMEMELLRLFRSQPDGMRNAVLNLLAEANGTRLVTGIRRAVSGGGRESRSADKRDG